MPRSSPDLLHYPHSMFKAGAFALGSTSGCRATAKSINRAMRILRVVFPLTLLVCASSLGLLLRGEARDLLNWALRQAGYPCLSVSLSLSHTPVPRRTAWRTVKRACMCARWRLGRGRAMDGWTRMSRMCLLHVPCDIESVSKTKVALEMIQRDIEAMFEWPSSAIFDGSGPCLKSLRISVTQGPRQFDLSRHT